jgi:hypothetical protein
VLHLCLSSGVIEELYLVNIQDVVGHMRLMNWAKRINVIMESNTYIFSKLQKESKFIVYMKTPVLAIGDFGYHKNELLIFYFPSSK